MSTPRWYVTAGALLVVALGSAGCAESQDAKVVVEDPTETRVADEDLALLVREEAYGPPETYWEYRIARDGSFSVVGEEPQRGFHARAGGKTRLDVQVLLGQLAELDFFDLSMDRIYRDMKTAPNSEPENLVMHAGPYRVRARHDGRDAEVNLGLVQERAGYYPTLTELQNAAECRRLIEEFLDRCCRR